MKNAFEYEAELAELQAAIAEEKKWRESAEGGWREANKVIAMQREKLDAQEAEIERLKGGQGEPAAEVVNHQSRDMCKVTVQNVKLLRSVPDGTKLYTSQPAPVSVVPKPVVWRIPISGDWFYGTKEQCEREYAEYTADFTSVDFDEDGPMQPEPLACLDKVKELNQ